MKMIRLAIFAAPLAFGAGIALAQATDIAAPPATPATSAAPADPADPGTDSAASAATPATAADPATPAEPAANASSNDPLALKAAPDGEKKARKKARKQN